MQTDIFKPKFATWDIGSQQLCNDTFIMSSIANKRYIETQVHETDQRNLP